MPKIRTGALVSFTLALSVLLMLIGLNAYHTSPPRPFQSWGEPDTSANVASSVAAFLDDRGNSGVSVSTGCVEYPVDQINPRMSMWVYGCLSMLHLRGTVQLPVLISLESTDGGVFIGRDSSATTVTFSNTARR